MKPAILLLSIVPLLGCDVTPEWPATADQWERYTDSLSAVSLEYPAQCTIDENAGGTLIRYDGAPIIAISHMTEAQAKKHGLWAAHESVDTCRLGGRDGKLYRYDHYDVFLGMHTVSYVVEHEGKWMALELRMKGDAPGPVQRRVIESFAFAASDNGGS